MIQLVALASYLYYKYSIVM